MHDHSSLCPGPGLDKAGIAIFRIGALAAGLVFFEIPELAPFVQAKEPVYICFKDLGVPSTDQDYQSTLYLFRSTDGHYHAGSAPRGIRAHDLSQRGMELEDYATPVLRMASANETPATPGPHYWDQWAPAAAVWVRLSGPLETCPIQHKFLAEHIVALL